MHGLVYCTLIDTKSDNFFTRNIILLILVTWIAYAESVAKSRFIVMKSTEQLLLQ